MAGTDSTKRGVHVADMASCLKGCSGTFGELAAVLRMIDKDAPEHGDVR